MSDGDCRNDCTLPLRFPRRPGTQQATIHGDRCPCCVRSNGVSQDNRPALSRFNYRIGTYGSIRQFLFHEIDRTPELLNWTHRTPDDPAVALLEGASILGDILTFYQELYANEAFLRTARWRDSISDLVRLLGYRLSPAVGGNAVFAFEIAKEEPVVIPAGFPVKATLEKLPKPADFETLDQLTAYPWLSRFNLFKPLIQKDIEPSTKEFYISAPEQLLFPVQLKAGDRLLIGELVGKTEPGGPVLEPFFNANAASLAVQQSAQKALFDANAALDSAQASKDEDSVLKGTADKVAEVAASDAAMQAVNQEIKTMSLAAAAAVKTASDCKDLTDEAKSSANSMTSIVWSTANDRALAPGVSESDFQSLIASLRPEIDLVTEKAADANTSAVANKDQITTTQVWIDGPQLGMLLGTLNLAALEAASREDKSKVAEKAAKDAADIANRLIGFAASSAAAGAADRVEASSLATQADRAAKIAKDDADPVPRDIQTFRDTTYGSFFVISAFIVVTAGAGLPAILLAFPLLEQKYNTAHDGASNTQRDTRDVKAKTQLVVDALTSSATDAARQSVVDRDAADKAIKEADRLAGLAVAAAAEAQKARRALIDAIDLVSKMVVIAAERADKCIADIRALILAIRAADIETVSEMVIASYDVSDDSSGPARLLNAEIVIVDSLRDLHGQKIFKIKGDLQRSAAVGRLAAFKLGRSFHHFGHNGPTTTTKTDEATTSTATSETHNGTTTTTVTNPPIEEKNIAFSRLLSSRTVNDETAIGLPQNLHAKRIVDPPLGKLEFPLESEVNDIPAGVTMVVQAELFASANTSKHAPFTLVRKVKNIKQMPVTWGLMTGSSSIVRFDLALSVSKDNARYRIADIRDFLIHETLSPLLTVKRAKEEADDLSGSFLNFYGSADEVRNLKARRIMFEKPKSEPYLRNVAEIPSFFLESTSKFKQLRRIGLSEPVNYQDFPNIDSQVTVFGNLADANEGKKMPEVPIGSGDAMQIFQNFKLPKAPLTYHLMPKNTPSETPELSIFVNGREWKQVDSFFGRGKNEHVYIVRQDTDGNSWVQFGDAKTGARLPSGIDNVTALYRIGDGAFGPLTEDTKVQASAKLKNLDKIQMPMDATGGGPAEDGESARSAAPGKVQSLGRIVSLRDYEAEAIAIPGVVSASAVWRLHRGVPAVAVTVLMETGRAGEIQTVENTLDQYDIERGAARNPIVVQGGARMFVALAIEYAMMPTYRADLVEPEIRRALGVNHAKPEREEDQTGLFSLRRRKLGAREYASSVEGWVQNIEGVLWAKATTFMQLSDEDDPASITVPDTTTLIDEVLCDGLHILSLYDEHLTLTLRAREVS